MLVLSGQLLFAFVMLVGAYEPVRRYSYRLFVASHVLFAPLILCAILHYNLLAAFMGLGGAVWLVDVLCIAHDLYSRPTQVLAVKTTHEVHLSPRCLKLW